jgi:predicted Kef-type K+ transport protein
LEETIQKQEEDVMFQLKEEDEAVVFLYFNPNKIIKKNPPLCMVAEVQCLIVYKSIIYYIILTSFKYFSNYIIISRMTLTNKFFVS